MILLYWLSQLQWYPHIVGKDHGNGAQQHLTRGKGPDKYVLANALQLLKKNALYSW
jgi:hypothetical protein